MEGAGEMSLCCDFLVKCCICQWPWVLFEWLEIWWWLPVAGEWSPWNWPAYLQFCESYPREKHRITSTGSIQMCGENTYV